MKRLTQLVVLVLLGFYLGWPAYSGYQIKAALDAKDAVTLANKIDFASVKESLRPAATAEAERTLAESLQKVGGSAGVLGADIAKKVLPRLVDKSLDALVTPESIIRIYVDGRALKDSVKQMVQEQLGKSGGVAGLGALIGKPAAPGESKSSNLSDVLDAVGKSTGIDLSKVVAKTATPFRTVAEPESGAVSAAVPNPKRYGIGNIKHIGLSGPLSVELGVAKDASASDADVTAEMTFQGTDWVLTGLRPRI